MPVELRKRKTPPAPAPAPRATKKKGAVAKAVDTVKQAADTVAAAVTETTEGVAEAVGAPPNGAAKETVAKPSKIAVGDVLKLDAFGGEIQTQDGEATTLYQLVGKSEKGVVIFTYPRASTPGCRFHMTIILYM
jgi:peroxiredoxin Q/BCP